MATNKQRRDAERRRLQQQLAERRAKELARRRFTLISSVVGSLAVIALIVVVIVAATSGSDKKTKSAASPSSSASSSAPTSTAPTSAASQCGQATFPTKKVRAATGATVKFMDVSVKGAADLGGKPGVTAASGKTPTKLEYKDLVVGKGAVAKPTSCVTVEYDGVLYKTGVEFDSSWKRSMLAQFSLTGVVPGFTEGIGGSSDVSPMKVGGRRLMILPSALGYGVNGSPPTIPANAPLIFVVDLVAVS